WPRDWSSDVCSSDLRFDRNGTCNLWLKREQRPSGAALQPQVARAIAIEPLGPKTRACQALGDELLAAAVLRRYGASGDQQPGEFERGRHCWDQMFSVNSVNDAASGFGFGTESGFTTGLPALLISHSRLFLESAAVSASSRV